jgi:hypothetical protein
LVTNAVVTWVTEYFGLAVAQLRAQGRWVDDEVLAHIWPSHHENVNVFYNGNFPLLFHNRFAILLYFSTS